MPRESPADRIASSEAASRTLGSGKASAADRLDEAIEDGLGGAAGELLEDDRLHQRVEAFGAAGNRVGSDAIDDGAENRIDAFQMRDGVGGIGRTYFGHDRDRA